MAQQQHGNNMFPGFAPAANLHQSPRQQQSQQQPTVFNPAQLQQQTQQQTQFAMNMNTNQFNPNPPMNPDQQQQQQFFSGDNWAQQPHHRHTPSSTTNQQQQQQPIDSQMGQQFINQFSSNPIAMMGMNQGMNFIHDKSQRYIPGVYGGWLALKYYFSVNNTYVLSKLKILLFPYRHKTWSRKIDHQSSPSGEASDVKYLLPALDVNAPDLYIPLMSFMTYILIVGYVKGTADSFSPDVIGEVATYCIVFQLLEIGLIKLGLHLLSSTASFLDLVAFSSYKYFCLVLTMMASILLGSVFYYLVLLYSGLALAYFTLNSMKGSIPTPNNEAKKLRNYLLTAIALCQIILIWWHCYV